MVTKKDNCDSKRNFCKFDELSRKWALVIIKDLFLGCKKFNDFLEINADLSNKVLSDQLKRLEKYKFITKKIVSTTPLKAEYELTKIGFDLNKVLYEKFKFGIKHGFIDQGCPHFKNRTLEEIFNIKK